MLSSHKSLIPLNKVINYPIVLGKLKPVIRVSKCDNKQRKPIRKPVEKGREKSHHNWLCFAADWLKKEKPTASSSLSLVREKCTFT